MGKIIIGCWDCQYCGTTRISGELRECPNCGRPRDKDVRFYMADPENYAKDQEHANKDPDWLCPYCDSLNPASETVCKSCGAVRDRNTADYFENREQQAREKAQEQKPLSVSPAAPASSGRKRSPLLFIIIAAILIGLVVFLVLPKQKNMEIASCQWERTVAVEEYREFEESDWQLPQGAYDVQTNRELYGYESVLDHYETRTRQVPEQVLDGYDTSYSYEDLGNGSFERIEHRTPIYRTEYREETYQEAVYRNEPIYRTKYYYLIMRWVTDHYEKTSGSDDDPYFADIGVSDTRREGQKTEQYWVVDTENKKYPIAYDLWKGLSAGQKINAEVQFGEITAIK